MEPPIAPQPNSPDQDATPLPDASMKGGQASMADLQPGAPPVQPPLQENGQAEIPQPLPAAPSVSPAPESPAQQAAPIRESSKEGGQIILSTPNMGMVGEEFTLEIQAVNVNSVAAAPFVLTFDPNLVEPVSFAEGTFLQKNGVKSAFSSSIDAAGGAVTINLSLPAGGSGVSGTGVLATAVFRPKKPGMAAFGFRDVAFVSADGKRMTVTPFANSVGIR
jgi:general secretion pathway protein D